MKDPLFPELPEGDERAEHLAGLTDEELEGSLKEHEVAMQAIEEGNEDFLKGVTPEEELAELERGAEQIEAIKAEQKARADAAQEYLDTKGERLARMKASLSEGEAEAEGDEAEGEDEGDAEGDEPEGDAEAAAEGDEALADEPEDEPLAAVAEEKDSEEKDEKETEADASKDDEAKKEKSLAVSGRRQTVLRRPPAPTGDRRGKETGTALVAAAGQTGVRGGAMLDRMGLADSYKKVATSIGKPSKSEQGIEQRFLVASASFPFPADRILTPGEADLNARKIQAVIPAGVPGLRGLVASGGLCAPLENIYTIPNFASQARPVREALPGFQAERGGVNVPEASTIGDITTAVGIVSEEEDAQGGTFATKSCQDLECLDYVETAVSAIYHCREYGNLNARAWPERIAHENDLTMAAHSRTAEVFLLDRIKAQSIEATVGALGTTMNAFASLVHAILRAKAGVRRRLRMDESAQFRAIFPTWIGDILAADDALKQLDTADRARAALTAKLASYGVQIAYALDDPTGADTFAATQTDGAALEDFPAEVQYALYVEGAFIHLDMGVLELGLVRDSTLNSTNDFQLFGETFENVARIGPAQAALWITQDICANGVYPDLGTAPTCA